MSQEKQNKDDSTLIHLLESTSYDSIDVYNVKISIRVGGRIKSLYSVIFEKIIAFVEIHCS